MPIWLLQGMVFFYLPFPLPTPPVPCLLSSSIRIVFYILKNKLIIVMKALIACVLLLSVISPALADDRDCEKLAKDYQDDHGGYLVLIQPLKANGAYDLGEYNGHWINKAWSKTNGAYYYDSETDTYLHSEDEVLDWYDWYAGKQAVMFAQEEIPFPVIYHY